tara:strand:+ start:517 stop:705 length:189 start_codon:yes stop_codon:yes gene_type:complete
MTKTLFDILNKSELWISFEGTADLIKNILSSEYKYKKAGNDKTIFVAIINNISLLNLNFLKK